MKNICGEVARSLRHLAWVIEGRPDQRGAFERAQDVATDPRIRRRVVFVAWLAGVVVGEFVLPAASPLSDLVESFMRGAGCQQQLSGVAHLVIGEGAFAEQSEVSAAQRLAAGPVPIGTSGPNGLKGPSDLPDLAGS
jgi:hypothetical protein